MSQPPDRKARTTDPPAPGRTGARREHQETLLLSDVPDASTLLSDAGASDAGSMEPSSANVSSPSLAALGQRYDVLGEAGHGSMGNVYKARDRETGETVALKILKPEIASDQAMMERFKNELLFARKITHKNVCRLHDFNRIGGVACTSMEFVDGESLRSVLNRFGGLPFRKAVDVALQICSGLKEAHAQGIVHRDLKPENVMIDTQGNVKIMDFGIARSMEAGTRLTGSMVGTPAYMAPEQVAGKPVDYRTDIYSLGLMLYEMFTGVQAFHADTPIAVAMKQLREAPPLPREAEPSIPLHVERAILKCLEKDPPKRFQSVADLQKALRAPSGTGTNPSPLPLPQANQSSHPTGHPTGHPNPAPLGASISTAGRQTRRSPMRWVLAAAIPIVALVAMGAIGRYWRARNLAMLPATTSQAPKPPDLAFNKGPVQPEAPVRTDRSAPSGTAATKPRIAQPAHAATPSAVPGKTRRREVFSRVELPGKNPPRAPNAMPQQSQPAAKPPVDVQRRADAAFSENARGGNSGPGAGYIWVGRFEREERADETAKRITDLGLPVTVMPRKNDTGKFFVVATGPFGPDRIDSVLQWLKTQGFANVRRIKRQQPGQNQNANSGPSKSL